MSLIAITVIGHDRPGIIAEVTAVLADLGLNLEDSTMTILRGHFAMMLICAGPPTPPEIERALEPVTADGSLRVSAREVPPEPDAGAKGAPYVLTVHGGDRPGIVSAVSRELAAVGGNITDLTTRLTGSLYVLVAEVELPVAVDVEVLQGRLAGVGESLGVGVSLREQETDVL